MSAEQLFALFIYGGNLPGLPVRALLNALALDYYIVIAACGLSAILGAALHKKGTLAGLATSKVVATTTENDDNHDEEFIAPVQEATLQQTQLAYEVVSIADEEGPGDQV
eukprot:gene27131-35853_t